MKAHPPPRSFSDVARELGVSRTTIADLVRVQNLPVHTVPSNGTAKGLAHPEVSKLRTLLNKVS